MSIHCPNCNYAYNPDHVPECMVCGHSFVTGTPYVPVKQPTPNRMVRGQSSGSTELTHNPAGNIQRLPGAQSVRKDSNVLTGIITHIERNDERPPRDIYRFLSRLMIGILIAIPYAFFFIALGFLSLCFGILGIHSLSQLFNPVIWTSSVFRVMEVLMLRNIRGSDTFPVYRGTIEDASGIEQHFMIKGPLISGNLIMGSRVSMTGHWRNGTLYALYGEDTSSKTAIRTSYRNPWRVIFFVLLALYAALGLCALLYHMQVLPS